MPERSKRRLVTPRTRFARLRFLLEQLVLRDLRARLMLAVVIVGVVAVAAGLLVGVLDGGFSGTAEAVWWAFLRLTDPGYLGDDEGLARRSISTVVTVLGYVLFLGLLIAILTQWLVQTITRLESGVTPVVLSDHIVILGWTHQTPAIVESLLGAGARVDRFLARRGARRLRVVIMAERVDAALRQELRERLGHAAVGRRVLLRAGTPLRVDHLDRVAFRDSAAVILPGAGFAERQPDRIDSRTIKTLASVSRFASESGSEPPLAVAELFDARRVDVANRAYEGASEVVAADGIVSRLIAQSVRHRGLWSVLSELFTLSGGNKFCVRRVEGQAGVRFSDLRGRFGSAILLGFVRPGERRPSLNPDPDTVLEADDLPVFVARRYADCVPEPAGWPAAAKAPAKQAPRSPSDGSQRVLILGWSRKVPALLRELQRFGEGAFEIVVVSRTSVKEREEGLARFAESTNRANVRQIEASFAVPGAIEGLGVEQFHNVIILASEMLEEKEAADAVSVVAALTLRNLLADRPRIPEVLVELLEQENQRLFAGGNEDVMVSPALVSYLVSQVALRRELAGVFWELTRPWGAQLVLRRADAYLAEGERVRFEEIQRAVAARGEIAEPLEPVVRGGRVEPHLVEQEGLCVDRPKEVPQNGLKGPDRLPVDGEDPDPHRPFAGRLSVPIGFEKAPVEPHHCEEETERKTEPQPTQTHQSEDDPQDHVADQIDGTRRSRSIK